ncbi:MAG: hypothetical protein IT338_02195 [Thermomicrobiales bacterium]|nr:hypothetical protein [Thermomicrobiales bacterium]
MRFLTDAAWSFSLGTDPDVDFCVWVLQRDGLRVPPFDRHPDGDGTLRAAGLPPALWEAWFHRNIAAIDERRALLVAGRRQPTDFARLRALQPSALWSGDPAAGQRLATLADIYEDVMNERKEPGGVAELTLRDDAHLWDALAPYRRRLPPLRILFLDYPGPLRLVVPPRTIVIGVADWQPDREALSSEVLAGAADLSAVLREK